jgi:hypothetical protein
MVSPRGISGRFADRVRLSLSRRRYLTEEAERALLLEAVEGGLPLDQARELLAATVTRQGATREVTLNRDMEITIAATAGAKGWISRTAFDRATSLYQQLSGDAISAAEAQRRVKAMMLRRGWIVRGEAIFGTPQWFRDIPTA